MNRNLTELQQIFSIHTIEITADNLIDTTMIDGIDLIRSYTKPDSTTGYRHKYKINANKFKLIAGNNTLDSDSPAQNEVTTYSEYNAILSYLIDQYGFINSIITRIDYRSDEYNIPYERLYKLAKFVILLIADYHSLTNIFESTDPIKIILETVRAQNDNFEIEYYNKAEQAPKYKVQSRLELRAKKLYYADQGKIQAELTNWIERLYTVIDKNCKVKDDQGKQTTEINRLLSRINNGLIEQYHKDKKNGETVYLSEFIHEYRTSFFTTAQLVNFYQLAGDRNPRTAVSKYKRRRKIELFTPADLRAYVDIISAAAANFSEK